MASTSNATPLPTGGGSRNAKPSGTVKENTRGNPTPSKPPQTSNGLPSKAQVNKAAPGPSSNHTVTQNQQGRRPQSSGQHAPAAQQSHPRQPYQHQPHHPNHGLSRGGHGKGNYYGKNPGNQNQNFYNKTGNLQSAYHRPGFNTQQQAAQNTNQNFHPNPAPSFQSSNQNVTVNSGNAPKFLPVQDVRLLENPNLQRRVFVAKGEGQLIEQKVLSEPVNKIETTQAPPGNPNPNKGKDGFKQASSVKGPGTQQKQNNQSKSQTDSNAIKPAQTTKPPQVKTETKTVPISKPKQKCQFEIDLDREYNGNIGLFCGEPGVGILFIADSVTLKRESDWFSGKIGDKETTALQLEEPPTLVKLMLQYIHLGDFDEHTAEVPETAVELNALEAKEKSGGNCKDEVASQSSLNSSVPSADGDSRSFCSETTADRLKEIMMMAKKYGIEGMGKLAASKLQRTVDYATTYLAALEQRISQLKSEIDRTGLIKTAAETHKDHYIFYYYSKRTGYQERDFGETVQKIQGICENKENKDKNSYSQVKEEKNERCEAVKPEEISSNLGSESPKECSNHSKLPSPDKAKDEHPVNRGGIKDELKHEEAGSSNGTLQGGEKSTSNTLAETALASSAEDKNPEKITDQVAGQLLGPVTLPPASPNTTILSTVESDAKLENTLGENKDHRGAEDKNKKNDDVGKPDPMMQESKPDGAKQEDIAGDTVANETKTDIPEKPGSSGLNIKTISQEYAEKLHPSKLAEICLEKTGLATPFEVDDEPEELKKETDPVLEVIADTATNKIPDSDIQNSDPPQVQISLNADKEQGDEEEGGVSVAIIDSGQGFDDNAPKN
ncbi:hypothetical protein H072_4484 [Dactylellina haptotyla CBS 200.50]|uniref:BTB domain-containing protein n=1 Tax=Dactylellina haptotyla (strain CBS 200.50) TaxID=1284197 RepID=S8AKF4_DACHA|nr:hypothetical protein H072_4484 [Dactylellina haptotyla CBS 200.50]